MTLAQYVSDYLRDAQYRIAQLTGEIDSLKDEGEENPNFVLLKEKRMALIRFMRLVYDPFHSFQDAGYNFLKASTEWSDREIINEIEYLRDYTDMALIPYAVFTGFYPTIVNNILGDNFGGGGVANLPEGEYLNVLRYNINGELEAIPFPQYTGMGNLTINDYFSGRL
jgi:hypothetical protein